MTFASIVKPFFINNFASVLPLLSVIEDDAFQHLALILLRERNTG